MNTIKRLLAWLLGIAMIPTVIIMVWLVTFMSFDLLQVIQSSLSLNITIVVALIWGYAVIMMPIDDIDGFIN